MEMGPHIMPRAENTASLETTNLMQLTLAETSGLGIAEWIGRYAAAFRTLVDAEPELITEYSARPEETLDAVRDRLQQTLH